MKLKDKVRKLGLLSKKSVTKTIDGESFEFFPVSVMMLARMGSTFQPIINAVRKLMDQGGQLSAETTETQTDKATGNITHVVHKAAMAVEMAEFQTVNQDKAIDAAMKVLLGEQTRQALVELLASSLREKEDEVKEILEEMDLGTLGLFISGFLEANAKVFGPLVEQVKGHLKRRLTLVQSDPSQGEASESETSPTPSRSSES